MLNFVLVVAVVSALPDHFARSAVAVTQPAMFGTGVRMITDVNAAKVINVANIFVWANVHRRRWRTLGVEFPQIGHRW